MYVNGEMRPVETIPRMGGGEIKGNDDICYIVRTFVNATMYPQDNNKKREIENKRLFHVIKESWIKVKEIIQRR
jgi:hypothetical protein